MLPAHRIPEFVRITSRARSEVGPRRRFFGADPLTDVASTDELRVHSRTLNNANDVIAGSAQSSEDVVVLIIRISELERIDPTPAVRTASSSPSEMRVGILLSIVVARAQSTLLVWRLDPRRHVTHPL